MVSEKWDLSVQCCSDGTVQIQPMVMVMVMVRNWTDEDRLDKILPRLQGAAGEFVFGQLRREVRGDYAHLVYELNSRFRVVVTKKTYGAQFSHRCQKANECVEEYAAELKRLYDKANANRDEETRREDLLRRFLDGLYDEKARFQVEYITEPSDIDEAVYQVVDFQETRHRPLMGDGNGDRGVENMHVQSGLIRLSMRIVMMRAMEPFG